MQFAKIFLHTSRLKLERSDSPTLLIQFICSRVVDRYMVKVYVYASCLLYKLTAFFLLRKGFESEEVHLDKTC